LALFTVCSRFAISSLFTVILTLSEVEWGRIPVFSFLPLPGARAFAAVIHKNKLQKSEIFSTPEKHHPTHHDSPATHHKFTSKKPRSAHHFSQKPLQKHPSTT